MKRQDGSRAIPPENRFIKRFIGFIMVFAMVLAITSITAGSLAAAELSPERQAAVVQSDNPAAGAAQNLIPDETPDQTADLKPGQGTADQELATDQATGQTSDQPLALDQTTWQTSDQPLATDQTTWQTSGQPLATDQTTGQTSGQPLTIDTTPQPLNEDQPAGQTADAAAASAAAAQADLSSQTAIAPAGAAIVPLDAPLDTWTVTFDTAGGSDVPAQDVPYGLTAARPDPDPVREGYTFTGWYKGSASAAYNFSAAVNASFTLTAKWTPITYTVTFDSQGGTAVAAKKAAYGAAIAAPKNPTKAGNTFLGWTLDGAAYDFASPVYSDITLTASWDASILNIVFDSAGGSDVPAQQVEYGSLVQKPADPVREGYTFGGWYYGVYAYTFTKPATFEFTLTARWTQITYIVTFDSQGGTAVAPRKVNYGAAVAAPGNPSKAGNTFAGWTLGGAAYDFSTPVYSDFTLTASWNTGVRTVTFDSAGGSPVPSQSVLYGSKAEKPANPTREGYTFAGWYYGIYAYTFTGAVTFDFTLTARWAPITFTVTFDSQGGTAVAPRKVNYGAAVAAPGNPSKAGNTFAGWTLGGAAYDFSTPVYSDFTLTASWNTGVRTVTFDSAGGSPVPSQSVLYGSKAEKPADPTREGYTFAGWYYGIYAYTFTGAVTFDFTLTARWTRITYKVTFDSNGGTPVAARTVAYGAAAAKPSNPSRAGSNFLGWTLDGAAYDFAAPVYSDITLTAVWETKTLTVTFDSAGGSPVPSQGVLYGSQAVKPANPTRDGYNFAGWYYGIFAYTFTGPVTFDFTLTARWQQITYKVTFDSNGGSAVPSRTVYSGNPVSKPADPVRTGYTFNGWYLDGAPYDFSAPVAGDLALKAGWDIRNYMVTFDSAGGSPVAAVTATYGSQLQKPADPVREGYTFTGWYAAYALAPYSFTGPVTSSFTLTARWKQITYTVRFDSAGGSAVLARTVVYNELKTSAKRPMFYRAKFEARFQTKRL